MRVIVTGGAGYIGSHACKALAKQGHIPIVIDDLSRGHRQAVQWGPLHVTHLSETEKLVRIFESEKPDAVMHFAAFAYVGESVREPKKYHQNNVEGLRSLIDAMKKANLQKIVFSSTCAIYGIPEKSPIDEETPQRPLNPYGETKRLCEDLLRQSGLNAVALRYFNAAGADPECDVGENHQPETHLIPLALEALDPQRPLTIMGTDYPTSDGTCVRDYIHVMDLAEAHILALGYLSKAAQKFSYFNLGTGQGISVREIVTAVEKVTQQKVHVVMGPRREGDPPTLVAQAQKAFQMLEWKPRHSGLENIIRTAYRWHSKLAESLP